MELMTKTTSSILFIHDIYKILSFRVSSFLYKDCKIIIIHAQIPRVCPVLLNTCNNLYQHLATVIPDQQQFSRVAPYIIFHPDAHLLPHQALAKGEMHLCFHRTRPSSMGDRTLQFEPRMGNTACTTSKD